MTQSNKNAAARSRQCSLQLFAGAVLFLCLENGAFAQGDADSDKAALEALYDATDGANWTHSTNWKSGEPLSKWFGLAVDANGRVTGVNLANNDLTGSVPAAIGDLDKLQQLALTDNALSGALPSELEDLAALESLRLGGNRALSGPLPSGMSELTNVDSLWIINTELCVPDDADFQAWLDNLTFGGLICPPTSRSTIDLAVFYTPAAREAARGSGAIEAEIDLVVAETNKAYADGGVNQRVALVAVAEVDYMESTGLTDLQRLHNTSDGHMDGIHAIRDQFAADIVVLIRKGFGAHAFVMRTVSSSFDGEAFAVVGMPGSKVFGGGKTLAHELGHVMGLRHDRFEACDGGSCDRAAFPYAYGYVNQRAFEEGVADATRWRTIMSYDAQCDDAGFDCVWLPRFSNPDQSHPDPGGDALGKSGLEPSDAVDGPSDAVRALNRTRGYVEKFRGAPQIAVSFAADRYAATEGGSAASVTVRLSEAPTRPVEVPLVATGASGASVYDFELPSSVRFGAEETERSFTVTAVDDGADDDNESATLSFGTPLPAGVSAGGTIQAAVTLNDNDTVVGAPSVLSVDLTSSPGPEGVYAPGDVVEASVRFDKSVAVTGTPQLELTVGNATPEAGHNRTAGDVLWFVYSVRDGDSAPDGIAIAANSLTVNGGIIRDGANQDADLTHAAVAADSNHRVDGVKPAVQTAAVDGELLKLTFSEPLDEESVPEAAGTAGDLRVTVGAAARGVASVEIAGESLSVTLETQVLQGDEVTVDYTPGTRPIQDLVGNEAAALSGQSVTNITAMPYYDRDGDGLIGIRTLEQLDAIRHDLDGDGVPTTAGATAYRAAFADAFPNEDARLRCAAEGCVGYELLADLDFDTDGSGTVDAGDSFWNGGAGWVAIGLYPNVVTATFHGNGHRIRNLYINRPSTNSIGLFASTSRAGASAGSPRGVVRDVALIDVDVTGKAVVGSLASSAGAPVINSYATGHVVGTSNVGGLVGRSTAEINGSYANVLVSGTSIVGGLAGANSGSITASYATGRVSATHSVQGPGGLVGNNSGTVEASYSTSRVSGSGHRSGGLVASGFGTVTESYWDQLTSGQASGSPGSATTTNLLQEPQGYTGHFSYWNVDTNGDASADDPWDFGDSGEYPVLRTDLDGNGTTSWEEFGYQLRVGPVLTVASDSSQVMLTWTAVDVSAWAQAPPTVVYTVIRDDGDDVETVASGLEALAYTDREVTAGETYSYQVAAGIGTGEATRSPIKEVTVIATDSTPPSIESMESGAMHPTKDPFTVTITFSESVTDLLAEEIRVTNGTGSNFSGSGSTYRLRVAPDADFEGDVTVSIDAGAAKDSSDNTSEAGSAEFAVDTRAPVLLSGEEASADGASLTVVFDENLAAAYRLGSAFAVTGGTIRSLSGGFVVGTAVLFTVSPPVLYGETGIDLDYSAPSQGGLTDWAGNRVASFEDAVVSNETPASTVSSELGLSLDTVSWAEGDGAKTVVVTGMLNRSARPTATNVTVAVGAAGDTATEGMDYTTVEDLTLTIPAYATSATANFTLTPANDRIDEPEESLTVTGSTTATGLGITPAGGLSIRLADNDPAPVLQLSVDRSSFPEDGGTATVTVGTGSGSTFENAQTVVLSVAGTATENVDYTISGKALTLPAGMGTSASTVSASLTGVDDGEDDDGETVVVSGTRNGTGFGERRTVSIEDDDDPEVTVSFAQATYRVAEGGHVDVAVTLSAVPERRVSIAVEAEGTNGADSTDFSISPASLSFGPNDTSKTVRVSAVNDSGVDPGEGVELQFGDLPDRVSDGDVVSAAVAIRDEDFTFEPVFAAGSGTTKSATDVFAADEDAGSLRVSLSLETPGGVSTEDVAEPVVVTLETRENAGSLDTGEAHAAQRLAATFGDYGQYRQDLTFAPGDFSDDTSCGCARAERSVAVDIFDDRVYEPTEAFGLRVTRKSGRLAVSSTDITAKIVEDDAEPALTMTADPASIAEAGGTSTVTVGTGTGSTYPAAQTIELALSGTATEDTDFEIDAKRLTLPAGTGLNASEVATTIRALNDVIDDDGETVGVSASRDGTEFASRTIAIADDEDTSTRVDLSLDPGQVREDRGATPVKVTASLNGGARTEDTEVTVTVGALSDSAEAGADYAAVMSPTLTIEAGETKGEVTFTLTPENDSIAEGDEAITIDGDVSGLAVNPVTLTLNDDDAASTEVTLTLDPAEVRENAGSRTVRVTGTLNGGARTAETAVTVAVGASGDSAVEETDYSEVVDLELEIPANRTDGSVTFTLRPTNDSTAEGRETITVSGGTPGLTVNGARLALADDDAVSTRLVLSLNPSSLSEDALPTNVTVTGRLDAGARTTDTVATVTVGAAGDTAEEGTDYGSLPDRTLTVAANETSAEVAFTLSPDDDTVAEGTETITVGGRAAGLTVVEALLTLSDNDTPSRAVTLTVDPESVREDSAAQVTVTGTLDAAARPSDTPVRLTVGAAGDTAVPGTHYRRVSGEALTIPAGETNGTASFLLEPFDNESADGARALSITGTTTAADLRVGPAAGVSIELEDDDIPAVLVVPDALTVGEAESSDYRVSLQTQPTADVTVAITGVSGDVTLNRTSLVLTPGNFDDAQTVTVMAADDDDNVRDPDVRLRHRASGAVEYRGLSAEVVVSIRENDPSLLFSEARLEVPEGGSAPYTVALATEPSGTVTVTVGGASGDLSLDPTELFFGIGDWDAPHTVTVSAGEDDDSATDPAVTLTHLASGGGYDGIAGTIRATIVEKDAPPPGTGGGGGGGGGGAVNHPPVVERKIEDQTLGVGETMELDIRLNFYDRNQRALDYTLRSANPAVATAAVIGDALLEIRSHARGVTAITVTAADRRDERAADTFLVTVVGPVLIGLFPSAADPDREGFLRVINRSADAGEISVEAVDDRGVALGPVRLSVQGHSVAHFNSADLENGNPVKGLSAGVGSGEGDWRLVLDSELEFEVLSYIRTGDGFLTAMHDTVPLRDGAHHVAIFNPGSNPNQVSSLRLVNPGADEAEVTIEGIDDRGAAPGSPVVLTVPGGTSRTLTAAHLEAGTDVEGALGDGTGKWRLRVTSEGSVVVISLLSSPTGHLTNLSTAPDR